MGAKTPARIGRAGLFAVALAVAAAAPGVARSETPEEAAKKLDRQKSELAAKQDRDRALQKDMAAIADERREINARLVETAALVQRSEAQMTLIENRLAALERQEQGIRASLAREHGRISTLLAALQRMGRNPPPVIITRREDALKMVRSAMLIAMAFPELRSEARALTVKLGELVTVMNGIRKEGDNLRAETERLNTTRTRLASLLETKKQSLADRQAELKQVREATAEISKNVVDLSELIDKLNKQVTAPPAMAEFEAETQVKEAETQAQEEVVAALPPAAAPSPPTEPEAAPLAREAALDTSLGATPEAPPGADGQRTDKVALLTPAPGSDTPSSIVEMAPASTSLMPGSPDRIKPAIAFHEAKGKLPVPAQGRRVLGFGEKTQYGGTSKGLVLETRFGARVTSPCDGWVVYAGEFRSYGQLLIINAGAGYHVLVAGMSQMDVGPGQFVLAAEPIGTMSGAPRTAQLATEKTGMGLSAPQSSAPVLYIEFRKDGQPIDSGPWWVASHQKVLE